MGGLFLLLVLSIVMAIASFIAGALPLSMTLSQSQLRFISSIGIGILVGTSLIVIIPEGIEAIAVTGVKAHSHSHAARSLVGGDSPAVPWVRIGVPADLPQFGDLDLGVPAVVARAEADPAKGAPAADKEEDHNHGGEHGKSGEQEHGDHDGADLPTFYIGFSLVLGFVLMFLIERLPRHATERFLAGPTTRHISLDNLLETSSLNGDANGSGSGGSSGSGNGADESDGFLSSLLMPPSPKQSRSLATTTGLVIHAAADGIAMGASATTSDMKLGLIIFVAIMIHKAPAAFGLTSVLLKQGLSKRAARGHLIIFSLAAPVGAISTWFIVTLLGGGNMDGEAGRWWTGMLLLFSAGTFLYVAMHAMQDDGQLPGHDHHGSMNGYGELSMPSQRKQNKVQMRDTVATVAGMLLPLLTQFGHHH